RVGEQDLAGEEATARSPARLHQQRGLPWSIYRMTEARAADVALLAELEPPRRGRPFSTVVRAVLMGIATLWVASLLTFFVSNLTGVDPATAALARFLTHAQLQIFRRQQGLDRPVVERYW